MGEVGKRRQNPVPTLLLGLGHPRQTAFLKSLSASGVPVYAAHTEENPYCFSRRLTGFRRLPESPERQLDVLEQFGREHGGVLIPTNDDYVGLVSQNRERLAKYFVIPLPDWNVVGPMLDRARAYSVAKSTGINVPPYWCPETDSEMRATVAALQTETSDYILKTRSVLSPPADQKTMRQSKPAPRQKSEMIEACVEMRRQTGDYPLIQEVIPGAADSAIGVTMVISPRGEVLLAYCVRRLRLATYKLDAGYVHPYELGSVVCCETVHDREALGAARELAERFRYTGQITVEFRRDPRNRSLYLMKIEPRPVRATSLSRAIGMDVPTTLYQAFTGGSPTVATDYADGVIWLWLQAYGQSLLRNKHNNRRDILRVLRGSRRIRGLGEDLLDPVPLMATGARIISREVRGAVGRLGGRYRALARN